MKSILFLSLLLGYAPLLAQQNGIDQSSDLVTLPGGEKVLRWYGHTGRSYFVQVSDANAPLVKWSWAPIIEGGNNEEISYEVDGTANKGFYRLKYTDQIPSPGFTLDTADFDGDGLSNQFEINPPSPLLPTDPLDASDVDGDQIPDDWERWWAAQILASGITLSESQQFALLAGNIVPDEDIFGDGTTNAEQYAVSASAAASSASNPTGYSVRQKRRVVWGHIWAIPGNPLPTGEVRWIGAPSFEPYSVPETWFSPTTSQVDAELATQGPWVTIPWEEAPFKAIKTESRFQQIIYTSGYVYTEFLDEHNQYKLVCPTIAKTSRTFRFVKQTKSYGYPVAGSNPSKAFEMIEFTVPANRTTSQIVEVKPLFASGVDTHVSIEPIEIEIKRGGIGYNEDNVATTPEWRSQGGTIRDLVSIWDAHTSSTQPAALKGDWMKARVVIGDLAAVDLPADYIVWTIDGHPAPPPNTMETPSLSWPKDFGIQNIQATIGGSPYNIRVDIPDVGTMDHAGWLGQMVATHGLKIATVGAALADSYNRTETAWSDTYAGKLSARNALRHSSWIAHCASQDMITPAMAKLLGKAHEHNNFSSGINWAYESTMDLHNNATGATCIHQLNFGYPDTASIHNDLISKLTSGALWIWDSDGAEHSGFKATKKSDNTPIYP